jgi:predicted dehydrogenase
MKTIRFGIIGCGLMGRELASASARWCHLPEMTVRPELAAICDTNEALFDWYTRSFPALRLVTSDYHELLAGDLLDLVYCAVPHNLHQKLYCDIISAGKALLGEKPFGIDKPANDAIMDCIARHPGAFVRCSSQFPFFPAVQRICDMIEAGEFGRLIEVNTGFLHSSDLDARKKINWKRMVALNGEYGCMGDLGMHACHVPFRAGWIPQNVRAALCKIVRERPDGAGRMVPCETWDNATLLCETLDTASGETFPWTLKTQRIAPGEKNTWYIEVLGTRASARFSTKNANMVQIMHYEPGAEQAWQQIDVGHETAFGSITGGIFEFGFSDALLQMFAGFLHEMVHGKPIKHFAGCARPEEAALSHRLFTAALRSHKERSTEPVGQ